MVKTGIFATKEEIKVIQEKLKIAQNTPVIAFSSEHALRGGCSGDAWQSLKKHCHDVALKHGLPEIQGFYGMTQDGEFVTV